MKEYMRLKRFINIFISMLICVCILSACSNKNDIDNNTTNNEIEEVIEQVQEEDPNYPNVEGYPIQKDGYKLIKLYVDGYECFCDGYIKNEYPDTVFLIALEGIFDATHADGMCVGNENNDESFCACINGKLVLSRLGQPYLNVDGEIYDDLAPEIAVVYEDYKDYCCTTLYLEKTVGAIVHLSQDKSAAYIELNEKVDEDASKVYDLDLDATGILQAKSKINGEKKTLIYNEEGMTISATSSGGESGNNRPDYIDNTPVQRQKCSQCGGSGFTNYMQSVYDPVSKMNIMKSVSGVCPHCHGTGYQ